MEYTTNPITEAIERRVARIRQNPAVRAIAAELAHLDNEWLEGWMQSLSAGAWNGERVACALFPRHSAQMSILFRAYGECVVSALQDAAREVLAAREQLTTVLPDPTPADRRGEERVCSRDGLTKSERAALREPSCWEVIRLDGDLFHLVNAAAAGAEMFVRRISAALHEVTSNVNSLMMLFGGQCDCKHTLTVGKDGCKHATAVQVVEQYIAGTWPEPDPQPAAAEVGEPAPVGTYGHHFAAETCEAGGCSVPARLCSLHLIPGTRQAVSACTHAHATAAMIALSRRRTRRALAAAHAVGERLVA